MAENSKIEWTDATWNPIVGCSIVSPGCAHCYAMRMAARIQRINRTGGSNSNYVNHYDGTTQETKAGPVWTGKVAWAQPKVLRAPLGWKKPRRVFVNSMGDLFHESIPDEWIDRVFAVMALAQQHTFQVLTKRADRMRRYVDGIKPLEGKAWDRITEIAMDMGYQVRGYRGSGGTCGRPLPNVWLGVSAERQQEADERIPFLLKTPAVIRFASCEPLLGPLDLFNGDPDPRLGGHVATETYIGDWWPAGAPKGVPSTHGIDWIIVGGESGPHARPMATAWAESLRDQCRAAEVPFFMKQMSKKAPIPPDLMVREFPA